MAKALYRKYRSSSFDEVVGQKHITDTLKNAIEKDLISHAYLFTGPRGVGKTSVARILAREINNIPADDKATQIDIIEIDAASNRRIDEMRELRDKVNITPTSLKYKVYIIDEVHMLTREAFNALLKTLEEPPQHVIFILATTEAHKVPETIVSRTQRYSFKPIVEVDALEHLRKISDKESIKITDEALKLIANHGQGSFRDSISMLDQLAGISSSEIGASEVSLLLGVPDNQLLDDLISSVASNDPNSLFETLQNLREQGASPGNIAKEIISRLRKSLYNNDNQITATKAVSIMKALLNATGSNASYEQIEICLLESINFDENIKPGDKTLDPNENDNFIENNIAEDLNQKNASEDISIEVQDKSEKIIEQATDNSWDKILQLMKSQHNTLYGVLRMADATIADGKIILTFSFEFHKKQLEQNRNIEVLKKVINDSLGEKHEVQLLLKKPTIEPKKTDNSDKNKALSSVSNIFGDAELLE